MLDKQSRSNIFLSIIIMPLIAGAFLCTCTGAGSEKVVQDMAEERIGIDIILSTIFDGRDEYFSEITEFDSVIIVRTFDEWKTITEKLSASEQEKYAEHFFIHNALILHSFTTPNAIRQTKISNVSKNGKEFLIEINVVLDIQDVVGQTCVTIEVKKSDIENISSLHISRKFLPLSYQ